MAPPDISLLLPGSREPLASHGDDGKPYKILVGASGGLRVEMVGPGGAGATAENQEIELLALTDIATALADGSQKAIVRGGAKGITGAADVTSTEADADHQSLDVAEQFIPAAEDNTNGVIQGVRKPLATNTYAPTLATNFGAATKANVKASPGNVLGLVVSNANAAARFFQLHNKASAPAATEVPLYSFSVPAGGTLVVGDSFFVGSGGAFSTGIGFAWSTTIGTFTDSATASEHAVAVHYK